MNKATKSQKTDNKTAKIAGILVLLAVVILVILLLLRGCGSKGAELPAQPETGTGISYDSAAVVGGWDEPDMDKIVEGLNEQVEAGMINISMNTSPVFSDGTSEGNLMIVNEGVNRYPQIVEITRNDTGETIYKSGAIPVGSKIEKAKLSAEEPIQNSNQNNDHNRYNNNCILKKRNTLDITQRNKQVIFVHIQCLIGLTHHLQVY